MNKLTMFQQLNYTIKVVVENKDGKLIFQQVVNEPDDLNQVALVLPAVINNFDEASALLKQAVFPNNPLI